MKKTELKEIANNLVEVLKGMPDGTEISSAQLLMQNGYKLENFDFEELFDVNDYLFKAAKKNNITLDMSKHDGLIEGLPFNLDFVVRHEGSRNYMPITIQKISITDLQADAIVNAANEDLWQGSGVCGAIFRAAGPYELQAACDKIGHCDTGSAVITPGFASKAKYIIHAVGPRWSGGCHGEPAQLYGAYYRSLELAVANGCRSIGFPLISAGIFGYPQEQAWRKALEACADFLKDHPQADLQIVFAILDDTILATGQAMLAEIQG